MQSENVSKDINYSLFVLTRPHSSPARRRRNKRRLLRHEFVKRLSRVLDEFSHASSMDQPVDLSSKHANQNRKKIHGESREHTLSADLAFISTIEDYFGRSTLPSARFCTNFMELQGDVVKAKRHRDLFPLPLLEEWPAVIKIHKSREASYLSFANRMLLMLNYLQVGFKLSRLAAPKPGMRTEAQRSAQNHIAVRAAQFLERLFTNPDEALNVAGAFSEFEAVVGSGAQRLRSDAVALPEVATTCEPLDLIGEELASAISDPKKIFSGDVVVDEGLKRRFACAEDRKEYILLCIRELRCGKLRLRHCVKSGGAVLCIGNSNECSQRKIWHGASVSQCAARPPAPYKLANPGVFLELNIAPDEDIFFSKRDASTFFDKLRSPEAFHEYFAQPPVTYEEFANVGGLSMTEIKSMCEDGPSDGLATSETLLYPVHAVWPMGFSWSSAIGQACSVQCCLLAGIQDENILSLSHPSPIHQHEVVLVATDDVPTIHRQRERGQMTLSKLDAVMATCGMPGNEEKNITLETSITGLGCELTSKPAMCQPVRDKLKKLALGYLDLLLDPVASPRGVNAALGLSQWFCLMQRGMFSIYDSIYEFVRRTPVSERIPLPVPVQDEVVVALILLLLLSVSLERSWIPELTATDAAPEFGFGVVVSPYPVDKVASLGRLAEKRGDYVRIAPTSDSEPWRDRIGEPHYVDLTQANFRVVVMKRAHWAAHSSTLEGHALLLGVRRLARCIAKHNGKAVVLVDAKCILGAAAKGRTSAVALKNICRDLGASNILLKLLYIPSESNPSDSASRGRAISHKRRTQRKRRTRHSRWPGDKFLKALDSHLTALDDVMRAEAQYTSA